MTTPESGIDVIGFSVSPPQPTQLPTVPLTCIAPFLAPLKVDSPLYLAGLSIIISPPHLFDPIMLEQFTALENSDQSNIGQVCDPTRFQRLFSDIKYFGSYGWRFSPHQISLNVVGRKTTQDAKGMVGASDNSPNGVPGWSVPLKQPVGHCDSGQNQKASPCILATRY